MGVFSAFLYSFLLFGILFKLFPLLFVMDMNIREPSFKDIANLNKPVDALLGFLLVVV